ncbi:hypothetical protein Tco_1203680 [Tanacetum coccineum]
MSSYNQRECVGCGQPCDGFYCYLCTCQQCGVNLINGICLNCTYGDGKPVTCCGCEGPLNGGFCSFCASRAENSFAYDPIPNSFDDSQNLSDYPPQPQYQTYSCELCGNDAHYGYDCPPQVPFVYNQDPCFNQNFDEFPQTLPNLQIIREELADYINTPNLNCPAFYDDDDEYTIQYREYLENSSNVITPDLPTKEPNNSLSMGDEHLSTIPETELDEVINSSVEDLVPIPSEYTSISDDTCDVPFCDSSPPLDVLNDHFEIFSDFNDDCTLSDDDSFENIDYVEAAPPDSELVNLEEVKDEILCEKLLNINLLIAKIESLNDNPTPDCVLKSPSPFPIPVGDSDSFFKKSDTSLSYSDNSLPEFETFSNQTEETSSGSTTTHTDNYLPEYDSFLSKTKPDQGELTSVVMEDISGDPRVPNVLTTHPTLYLDSDFALSDDSLEPDLEVSFPSGFCFNLEKKSSGNPTSLSDLSLPDYEAFFCDSEPDSVDFTMDVVENIFDNPTRGNQELCANVYPPIPPFILIWEFLLFKWIPSDPTLFLLPNEFSISFIRDPLSPVFDTLLPFSSENEDNVFNPGILASNEEKSPHLLSHRGFKAFQLISDFSESSMMIYGGDIPILDVLFLHFYPPLTNSSMGDRVKLSDLKQALQNLPDFEDLVLAVFVLRSLELHILSFIMGIQYPNLID